MDNVETSSALVDISLAADFSESVTHLAAFHKEVASINKTHQSPVFIPMTGQYESSPGKHDINKRDKALVEVLEEAAPKNVELLFCYVSLERYEDGEMDASLELSKLDGVIIGKVYPDFNNSLWRFVGRKDKNESSSPSAKTWRRLGIIICPIENVVESLFAEDSAWEEVAENVLATVFTNGLEDTSPTGKTRHVLGLILNPKTIGIETSKPVPGKTQHRLLVWCMKANDQDLLAQAAQVVSYKQYFDEDFVAELAGRLNDEHKATHPPDWDGWLFRLVRAIPDPANTHGFLRVLCRQLDSAIQEPFRTWRAAMLEDKVLGVSKLYKRDVHPVMALIISHCDDEKWICDRFFPFLLKHASLGLQAFVLKALKDGAGRPSVFAGCVKNLAGSPLTRLALDPSHLTSTCMDDDRDFKHHRSKLPALSVKTPTGVLELCTEALRPYERFIDVLECVELSPEKFSLLIQAACKNMSSREFKNTTVDVNEARDLLAALQQNFHLDEYMAALVRAVFRRLELAWPARPQKPSNYSKNLIAPIKSCAKLACETCQKLSALFTSPTASSESFPKAEAGHVMAGLKRCTYIRAGTREDGTLVVAKTFNDYFAAVHGWITKVSSFHSKLRELRTSWMEDALGEKYEDYILLRSLRKQCFLDETHALKLASLDKTMMGREVNVTWHREYPCFGSTVTTDWKLESDPEPSATPGKKRKGLHEDSFGIFS